MRKGKILDDIPLRSPDRSETLLHVRFACTYLSFRPQVMTILKQSMDLCSDHDTWRLNVAHTLFMEKNYKDALR